MDISPYSPLGNGFKIPNNSDSKSARKSETDVSNELLSNLKRDYEERIRSLENHIKETYQLIENDEIIQTMKNNQVSNDFRKQRINEILEDSLGAEKEAQIEKLIDTNAILKTEMEKLEKENQTIVQTYNQELEKFNTTIEEYSNALQNETQIKSQLQEENEKLAKTLSSFLQQHENFVKQRDGAENQFYNELNRLKGENDILRKLKEDSDKMSKIKEDLIEEMRRDIETLKNEYIQLENVNESLNAEQNSLKTIISRFKDQVIQDELELTKLRESLTKAEEQNKNIKQELETTIQENFELVNKSEYISSQVKKLVENERKSKDDSVEEVKRKCKAQLEEQKYELDEVIRTNEALNNEIVILRNEIDINKANHEKSMSQALNDMEFIKTEWERKLQEVQAKAQQQINQLQGKHQEDINRIQIEFHALLQKRLKETNDEANREIARIRAIEQDTREQLDSRMLRFEKDYILKANHESILAAEVLDLKTKQMQNLKDLENKFEKEYAQRLKNAIDRNSQEYQNLMINQQSQSKSLEQQLASIKAENHQLFLNATREKEETQKLKTDLEEARAIHIELVKELEETRQNLVRVKGSYDEELRKRKKIEIEIEDISKRSQNMEQKEQDWNDLIETLRREISKLKEAESSQNQNLARVINQNRLMSGELEILNVNLETLEKEKKDLMIKLIEQEDELEEKQKVSEELETSQIEIRKLREKLNKSEVIKKDFEKEQNLNESTIRSLNNRIKELEELSSQNETHKQKFEEELLDWKEYKQKVGKKIGFLVRQMNILRQEVNQVKSRWKAELELTKENSEEIIQTLTRTMKNEINKWKNKCEVQKEKYEEKLQVKGEKLREENFKEKEKEKFEQEIEYLRKELESLNKDAQSAWIKVDESNKKILESENKTRRLEEDRTKLREESDRNASEFKKLQAFVENQLKRLREESESVAKQMLSKYKQEISGILLNIDELKSKRIGNMRKMEEYLFALQREYEKDFEETRTWYEKKSKDDEKLVNEAEKEVKELRKELEKVENASKELKRQNGKLMDSLEEKLKTIKEFMKLDKEKYSEKLLQQENEKLKQTVKNLKRELSFQKLKDKEFISSMDEVDGEKSKSLVIDRDLESIGAKRQRDKNLEELQNLLTKTMQNVERKSLKMEGRPEKDYSRNDTKRSVHKISDDLTNPKEIHNTDV